MTATQAFDLLAFVMLVSGGIAGILAIVGVTLVRREALRDLAEQDCRYARRRSFERNMTAAARR